MTRTEKVIFAVFLLGMGIIIASGEIKLGVFALMGFIVGRWGVER